MTEPDAASTAMWLTSQGYCVTSAAHFIVSRIDRPDWQQVIAKKILAPIAVVAKEPEMWADHYRRCDSKDKRTVTDEVRRLMVKSGNGFTEFIPKENNNGT